LLERAIDILGRAQWRGRLKQHDIVVIGTALDCIHHDIDAGSLVGR
jgi:hypothetical protein